MIHSGRRSGVYRGRAPMSSTFAALSHLARAAAEPLPTHYLAGKALRAEPMNYGMGPLPQFAEVSVVRQRFVFVVPRERYHSNATSMAARILAAGTSHPEFAASCPSTPALHFLRIHQWKKAANSPSARKFQVPRVRPATRPPELLVADPTQ